MENRFNKIGRVDCKITKVLSAAPVTGVNQTTGEVWSYLRVELQDTTSTDTKITNVFINQFNPIEKIVVGAHVDIVVSKDTTTGKINYAYFIGSNKLTNAKILKLAGADEATIDEGRKQARTALADALAKRIAKAKEMESQLAGA